MNQHHQPLLAALEDRDYAALDELMDSLAEQLGDQDIALAAFRQEVLPEASFEAVEAFWRHAMTGEQFDELIENMTMAAAQRLVQARMIPGTDFVSAKREDGMRFLFVSQKALGVLFGWFSKAQMTTLSIAIELMDDWQGPEPLC